MSVYKFPGVCFAGPFLVRIEQVMERVVADLAAGRYEYINRLHFLGTGEMQNICAYSTLQSCLRRETGRDSIITADAASPFIMSADGKIVFGFHLGVVEWTFMSASIGVLASMPATMLLEDALFEVWKAQVSNGAETPCVEPTPRKRQCNQHFFVRSEISKLVTVGDLNLLLNDKGKYKADGVGNRILMNHNTQIYMEGMVTSLHHYHANAPNMVPSQLIVLKEAIEKVFAAPPDRRPAVIEACSDELSILAGLTNAANKRVKYQEGIDERWAAPAGYLLPKVKKK